VADIRVCDKRIKCVARTDKRIIHGKLVCGVSTCSVSARSNDKRELTAEHP